MRFFLDTNLVSYIASSPRQEAILRHFLRHRYRVAVTTELLVEISRAPAAERVARFTLLRSLGARFTFPPSDFVEAAEVRAEITRCHPEWLQPSPDATDAHRLLAERRDVWVQYVRDPAFDIAALLPPYLEASGSATRQVAEFQKGVRQFVRENPGARVAATDPDIARLIQPHDDFNRYWRLASAQAWHQALRGGKSMRDYRDWLSPYVLPGTTDRKEWFLFWASEVNPRQVSRSSLRCAVEYCQVSQKVTIGNAADANHALNLLSVDRFLTCDRDFHAAMCKAAAILPFRMPLPRLVDRSLQDPLEAILNALR